MFKIFKWVVILSVLYISADILASFVYPDVSILKKYNPNTTAFMEYRKKEWAVKRLNRTVDFRWVKLKNVSPYLIKAVIIAEDDKFWGHDGFDYDAIKKAFEKNLAERKFKTGGSSISQQVAKNLYLSPSKNPVRKIKEAILTYRLEKTLTKKRIMELYINIAEWGDGIFGIEAASNHYYRKKASGLTAMEAVRLACVLPNPIVFDPLSSTSKYVKRRSRAIYRVMLRRGLVIPEYEEVVKGPDEDISDTPVNIMSLGMEDVLMENTDSFETPQPVQDNNNLPAEQVPAAELKENPAETLPIQPDIQEDYINDEKELPWSESENF